MSFNFGSFQKCRTVIAALKYFLELRFRLVKGSVTRSFTGNKQRVIIFLITRWGNLHAYYFSERGVNLAVVKYITSFQYLLICTWHRSVVVTCICTLADSELMTRNVIWVNHKRSSRLDISEVFSLINNYIQFNDLIMLFPLIITIISNIESGWVGCEELCRSGRMFSPEAFSLGG